MQRENMKSLMKAFDIMELFLSHQDELSVAEISGTLGLNQTTVRRILQKMTKRGYLTPIEKRGKYWLGTIFLEYYGVIKNRMKIRDIAMPYLFELSRNAGEVAILGIWNGRGLMISESFHDKAYLDNPLKVIADEGVNMPLYCTCIGKACLAGMSEEEVDEYLENTRLETRTPNTITEAATLIEQLTLIREAGVAFDNEEFALGLKGVGAGLLNNEGKTVGSVAVLAPSVRITDHGLRKIAPSVKNCAADISRKLGYIPNRKH